MKSTLDQEKPMSRSICITEPHRRKLESFEYSSIIESVHDNSTYNDRKSEFVLHSLNIDCIHESKFDLKRDIH